MQRYEPEFSIQFLDHAFPEASPWWLRGLVSDDLFHELIDFVTHLMFTFNNVIVFSYRNYIETVVRHVMRISNQTDRIIQVFPHVQPATLVDQAYHRVLVLELTSQFLQQGLNRTAELRTEWSANPVNNLVGRTEDMIRDLPMPVDTGLLLRDRRLYFDRGFFLADTEARDQFFALLYSIPPHLQNTGDVEVQGYRILHARLQNMYNQEEDVNIERNLEPVPGLHEVFTPYHALLNRATIAAGNRRRAKQRAARLRMIAMIFVVGARKQRMVDPESILGRIHPDTVQMIFDLVVMQ